MGKGVEGEFFIDEVVDSSLTTRKIFPFCEWKLSKFNS
jgi:hypothetical protein